MHVRHVSQNPNASMFAHNRKYFEFVCDVSPLDGEYVVTKSGLGAFYDNDLDTFLHSLEAIHLFLCGLLSFMCAATTACEAYARGYSVLFVRNATASIPISGVSAEMIHKVVCAIQG